MRVGNNIYIGTYSDRDTKKFIYFNDLFYISSRNSVIAMGINNGNLYEGKFYVTSGGGCTVNGTDITITSSGNILLDAKSINVNGTTKFANTVYYQNDQQIYGGYYSSSYNLYISAPSGYLAFYSRGNALYYDGKYIDSNWSGGKFNPGRSGVALGGNTTSERWYRLYASNASNTSSDRRLKTNFSKFDERYINLFEKLEPTIYNFISNENGNKEAGMIAQDVKSVMKDCNISVEEFGAYETDNDGMYSLIYQDIDMLTVYYVQTKSKEFSIHLNKHDEEIQNLKNVNKHLSQELENTKQKLEAFINGNFELNTVTREVA